MKLRDAEVGKTYRFKHFAATFEIERFSHKAVYVLNNGRGKDRLWLDEEREILEVVDHVPIQLCQAQAGKRYNDGRGFTFFVNSTNGTAYMTVTFKDPFGVEHYEELYLPSVTDLVLIYEEI